MTTIVVIAAVLFAAEGGTPAPALKLNPTDTTPQALPVVVDQKVARVANEGGLIKPVEYRPSEPKDLAPVVRASSFISVRQSSSADASPSDSIVPPPVPAAAAFDSPTSAQDTSHFTGLSESYSVHDDYQVGCDTCGGNECSCQSAHGCNLCGGCSSCGYGHGHGGFYAHHCLPSPWHAPGNMVPHIPYEALPKTYYYFRPYQMFMIPDQQAQAAGWVENPALPYSNNVFEKVYAELESELNPQGEEVDPVAPVN